MSDQPKAPATVALSGVAKATVASVTHGAPAAAKTAAIKPPTIVQIPTRGK